MYKYIPRTPVKAGVFGEYQLQETGPVTSGAFGQSLIVTPGADSGVFGRYQLAPAKPLFRGLGQVGEGATTGAMIVGSLVVAAVQFGLMIGAAYLGSKWAGCGR